MKKTLILFCSIALVTIITITAYNSDKGPARQTDGITELPQPKNDSLVKRGRDLLSKTNFTEQDMQAIAAYLNSRY